MAGEEGLAVELEVALILVEEAIEPREELLGAVVGVKDNRDTVGGSKATDVVGSSDTTGNGDLLAVIADTLRDISGLLGAVDPDARRDRFRLTLPAK